MQTSSRAVLALALLALTGCGGGSGDPGPEPVATVVVSAPQTTLVVGRQPVPLSATTTGANGAPLAGRTVTWSSSDDRIATVTPGGLVTATGEGAVTITATSEGKQGSAGLTSRFPFPSVAGTYNITATFDAVASTVARGTGVVSLTQSSRTAGTLTGAAALTGVGSGVPISMTGLSAATVTETGTVQFVVGSGGVVWQFSGQLTGTAIFGRHTMLNGSIARVGEFTMTRTAR